MKQYYISKNKGGCGPSTFINLIGLKGSKKLEKKISDLGRLHPFFANDYTSFLIWGREYNKNIIVYVTSKTLNKKMIKFMAKYEGISKNKLEKYEYKVRKRHNKLNKIFSNKINLIKNPMKKLNQLLNENHKVAFLVSDFYFNKNKLYAPHWVLIIKKINNKYKIIDPTKGLIYLTKNDIIKGLKLNKKIGFNAQLIISTK
ncbi:MAG: hypothetical protein J7K26_03030 [Candidatus Aenigmarchaeota archaeon]|nr:hypothetical protein [Candidatus Aenigmarchaeota archaeon]